MSEDLKPSEEIRPERFRDKGSEFIEITPPKSPKKSPEKKPKS